MRRATLPDGQDLFFTIASCGWGMHPIVKPHRALLAAFWTLALSALCAAEDFVLTVIHTNDLHARIEPTARRDQSFGGYARQATVIRKLRNAHANSVLLNGGDTFQGTLYFNVYEGLADLAFMNYIGYDAMAVGNHEFDKGPAPLERFARLAKFPVLASNLDLTGEPELAKVIRRHIVLEVGGQKVGVIGLLTDDTPNISSPGENVKFLDQVASVRRSIGELETQGVNKIVLLTHIGYAEDVAIAKRIPELDVVVGGHSHTLLGEAVEGLQPPGGPYPTLVEGEGGHRTLVVQAGDWGRVVGLLHVKFDEGGRVKSWQGQPIVVDKDVTEDPVAAAMAQAFKKPIEAKANEVVGHTETGLPRDNGPQGENPMGNVIADAMHAATEKAGAVMATMNAGGVRAPIDAGPITYGHAITVQPFGNTLTLLDLSGAELKAVLEHGLANAPEYSGAFLHVSKNVRVEYDPKRPAGDRITNLTISGKAIAPGDTYRICTNSFTAGGGDFHDVLKNAKGYRLDTGLLDLDALLDYLKANKPTNRTIEGRIVRIGG